MLKAKDKKGLPDQNLSQVARELAINVFLCVSKLQAVDVVINFVCHFISNRYLAIRKKNNRW